MMISYWLKRVVTNLLKKLMILDVFILSRLASISSKRRICFCKERDMVKSNASYEIVFSPPDND
jgi:hypothetical protein